MAQDQAQRQTATQRQPFTCKFLSLLSKLPTPGETGFPAALSFALAQRSLSAGDSSICGRLFGDGWNGPSTIVDTHC